MLTAILSNFGLAAALSAIVAAVTVMGALLVAARARSAGAPLLQPVARVLAVGSALLIVSATASPYSLPLARYGFGDLVLQPGGAGLGDIGQTLASPTSLAAVLLGANVALYLPLAFWASLGWPARSTSILLAAVGLSLAIEAVQFVALERIAATDDVLLNGTGALIGLGLGVTLRRLRRPRSLSVSAGERRA